MFHIVLVEPQIPPNTGNIARTCATTGCMLHLVEPLGFSISDSQLKRAGLDYWDKVFVDTYPSLQALMDKYPNENYVFCTTKAACRYDEKPYPKGTFMVFGKETQGLPRELIEREAHRTVRIPMRQGLRSLNLGNAVAVMVYEGLRQNGFDGLL